jgi:hypothetical protein
MLICKKCGKAFSFRIKIDGKSRNLGNRKFCLDCSPFLSHNTIDLTKRESSNQDYKTCPNCNRRLHFSFFYKDSIKRTSTYCKECCCLLTAKKQIILKQACVDYKGGKCERCGYNKFLGALEFHHMDESKKEFTIAKAKSKEITDKIRNELDKCMLLCANCHREIHNELVLLIRQNFESLLNKNS